uniref:DNA-directed DNA polymerase n=1 Tax=viral metagenome TaxID=1070528 RepID=A0A6C0BBN3_9ZZZZ
MKQTIITALDTLRKMDFAEKRHFQAVAYQKAIQQLTAFPGEIASSKDVQHLPGLGTKILKKIDEIVETGSLAAAERAKADPAFGAYELLLNVYGIGPSKAKALIEKGVTTLEKLALEPLTPAQKLGVTYYHDFLERIPREEMRTHEAYLQEELDSAFTMAVVGSYRRGAESSGDIDVLMTLPDSMTGAERNTLFKNAVANLQRLGYIKGVLAFGITKCLCICQLEGGKARRLDLLMIPAAEFPYAILYFTGSDLFNVAFRSYALEKGYTMNEHGMVPTGTAAPPPPMRTEKDIFNFLGLEYVEPNKRVGKASVKVIT